MNELDAIVLADDPRAAIRIAGLAVRERAIRIARRVGATRVLVVDGSTTTRAAIAAWRDGSNAPLLVIRADQLVHTPLVAPLVETRPTFGKAVDRAGEYGGALFATGPSTQTITARLAAGESDTAIAADAQAAIEHGAVARHAIDTPEARRGAHALLYKILIKPQDNAITRYLYRPVSMPLTKLLAWTPITPNQISYLVAALVVVGCWLTAHAQLSYVIAGSAVILAASYVDCCDGEIARLKLLSSRFGAWSDTIVDELSTVGYMAALGYHCHLAYGPKYFGELPFDPWIAVMVFSVATYVGAIYCVYYNIIVAVGSANSQDYVGRFEVVPGAQPNSVKLRPAATAAIAPKSELPGWVTFILTYLPYIVRRDFICWGALVLAIANITHISFALQALGGIVSFAILSIDHVKLRSLRRSILRRGQILESPAR